MRWFILFYTKRVRKKKKGESNTRRKHVFLLSPAFPGKVSELSRETIRFFFFLFFTIFPFCRILIFFWRWRLVTLFSEGKNLIFIPGSAYKIRKSSSHVWNTGYVTQKLLLHFFYNVLVQRRLCFLYFIKTK